MFEWTEIITAAIAALTAGGWLVSRRQRAKDEEEHKTKIAAMEAKITSSLRDSETRYTREALEIYSDNVVKPLRDEIRILRDNQIRFQAAINAAPSCRLFPDCVVIKRMRLKEDAGHRDEVGSDDLGRHDDFDTCATS